LQVAKAMTGVYDRNRMFLDHKFNPAKPTEFYPFLKGVIKELLLACRKNGVDVIATTESKNVWKNYGSKAKDDANKPKILGQMARVLDPWFQFGDVILVLSRIKGNRDDGAAKLTTFPTATMDTFKTKCSLPGLAPEFVFKGGPRPRYRRHPHRARHGAIRTEWSGENLPWTTYRSRGAKAVPRYVSHLH
jgi:hypothetical protein